MATGYICLVLHAHLPYVRHPELSKSMEEDWFYEAVLETYIPLLMAFDRLTRDNVDFRITVSLSPTLLSMMEDDLLKVRCAAKLDKLIELAEKELDRTAREDSAYSSVAHNYHRHFLDVRETFRYYDGRLSQGFRRFMNIGKVE
jgi:1,4-alpha-glucan branching enzyme